MLSVQLISILTTVEAEDELTPVLQLGSNIYPPLCPCVTQFQFSHSSDYLKFRNGAEVKMIINLRKELIAIQKLSVTVNDAISKVFTTILKERLTELVEHKELLGLIQFGGRKNKRTTDALFILTTVMEKTK